MATVPGYDVSEGHDIRLNWIPAERYVGPTIAESEKSRLWPRVWHIACRESEVPEIGDYVAYDCQDESIIVYRATKSDIKAVFNVCQHRGRRLVDEERGNLATAGFVCRFHGWRWRLDGSIAHVHCADDWHEAPLPDSSELALKEPLVGFWAGWVWINADRNAEPLLQWLGEIPPIMENFEFQALSIRWHHVLVAPVNWKVFVEAFAEGYHSGQTHHDRISYYEMSAPAREHGLHSMLHMGARGLVRIKVDGGWRKAKSWSEQIYYQCLEFHDRLFAIVLEPAMDAARRLYKESPDEQDQDVAFARLFELHREEIERTGTKWPEKLTADDLKKAGTLWHVFPSTIFLPTPDGVLWHRYRPCGDDPDKCVVDLWCLERPSPGKEPVVKRSNTDGFDNFKGSNAFLEEDFDNMIAVNLGMKSKGWGGARTNPVQERAISSFHRNLRKFIG